MATLKALRMRINSVKSTRKITQAMKMVAAAKLRRAQSQAEAARPYAERMARMLGSLGAAVAGSPDAPRLLAGTGRDQTFLLVVVSAERGLAGAFNTNVSRLGRARTRELESQGKTVKILTVGRKGAAFLKRELADRVVREVSFAGQKRVGFEDAASVAVGHHIANHLAVDAQALGEIEGALHHRALADQTAYRRCLFLAPPHLRVLRVPALTASRSATPCWHPARPSP